MVIARDNQNAKTKGQATPWRSITKKICIVRQKTGLISKTLQKKNNAQLDGLFPHLWLEEPHLIHQVGVCQNSSLATLAPWGIPKKKYVTSQHHRIVLDKVH